MQMMVTARAAYNEVSFTLKEAAEGFLGSDASTFSAEVEKTCDMSLIMPADDADLRCTATDCVRDLNCLR